jgi:hypothetical protein
VAANDDRHDTRRQPFDAPAVLIVGHQSSGKSALIEALMGFQFNQVGGGTKTRRPIALRMQYEPSAAKPRCFLTDDVTGREREVGRRSARPLSRHPARASPSSGRRAPREPAEVQIAHALRHSRASGDRSA